MHPPRKRFRPILLLGLGAMLAAGLAAYGRVFVRWPGAGDVARVFAGLGGKPLYESRVAINDGQGDLAIYGLHRALADVVADLRRLYGEQAIEFAGGTLANGLVQRPDNVLRLVLVQPEADGKTMAFTVSQSPEDFRQSSAVPRARPLPELPAYPGSVTHSFVADTRTGAEFGLATAPAAARDVRAFYADALRRAGWNPLLQPAPGPQPTGSDAAPFMVYGRNQDLCLLLVAEAPGGDGTSITLLHKRQGME